MKRHIVKGLMKPKRMDAEVLTQTYGKFVFEPLERGFGTTIGNSLRRILLSSLPGSAITTVKLDGVEHEFSTIPGCVEDVTEIILNLKEVVLDLGEHDEIEVNINASGPAEVTAGDLEVPVGVTIANPDLHICSLTDDGKVSGTLTAKIGRGYVVSEQNKPEDRVIGLISLDAIYSPIRKVNHSVTNARVGQRTDYDKLTLELWTDGSVKPDDALQASAMILRDQLVVFAGGEEAPEEPVVQETQDKPKFNENLFRRIEELELSVRSSNCLENADIKFIGELVQRTEAEMLRTKNFGRKSLNEIKEILTEMSLSLGMKLDGFPNRAGLEKVAEEQGNAYA